MPTSYDPKKAAAYNKLVQSGMSEDAAFAQSGITDAEAGNYALGTNGQLGATVAGGGKVAGVDYALPTAADTAESNRFNQGLASSSKFEEAGYPEKASAPPGSVKPITYTTTSTESVSGGGTTSVIAGPRQPTASSQAIQPAIAAKQAEIDQFQKDNPSDFARKKQGLPPLTPEEKQQRQEQLDKLTAERGELKNQQINAETPSTTPATTTPNTTTTTQTVTTGTTSTNQQVDPETDQKLSQENEAQLAATPSAADSTTAREAAPVSETQPVVASGTPDLVSSPDPVATGVQSQTTVDEFGQIVAAPEPVATGVQSQTTVDEFGQVVAVESPAAVDQPQPQTTVDEFGQIVPVSGPAPVDATQDPYTDLQTADGQTEGEGDAGTGLREPSEEDVNAAEIAAKENAILQATLQSRYKQPGDQDWRVRISLSAQSDYLYNEPSAGILSRLKATNGVVFPYTPSIETNYLANYEKVDLTHSNYRGAYYKNSAVSDINIRGTFTAQDTSEAEYMLAVIHFFRSVTKMFYGKDEQRGAPPPLVYLTGFGDYQFAGHPCVVTNFSYSLPSDVDYIRANNPNNYGTDLLNRRAAPLSSPTAFSGQNARQAILAAVGIPFGATPSKPTPGPVSNSVTNTVRATYVPTKIEINVTLMPMQTRDQLSKLFSLKEFASGKLIKGGFW